MQNENIKKIAVSPEYIKKTLKFEDSQVLHINIKYPDIKISPADCDKHAGKKINDFYSFIIKSFINYCEKVLYKQAAYQYHKNIEGFKPFGAVMTFETAYNRQDYLCIYLDISIYAGKGRGNTKRTAQIWACKGGELVAPERFIKFTRRNKIKICGYISKTMKNQIENGEERYIKYDLPSVYKYLSMKNFYLSEKGYSFFFPQNTIAPPESGIVSFAVPEEILNGG